MTTKHKKPRLGMDVDGVLADLLSPCLRVAGEMLGRTIWPDDLQSWEIGDLFTDPADVERLWDRMGEPGVCANLEPYPGAVEGMRALSEVADVYVVTSYLHNGKQWVHERDGWVMQHFGIPRSKMVHTRAKHIFSGAMLVDDKPANVADWALENPHGVPVLWLMPYNDKHQFPDGIRDHVLRTRSWPELARVAEALTTGQRA